MNCRPDDPPARSAALDGMRGIAIISVLLFHYGYFATSTDPVQGAASVLFSLFDLGWLGVDLFFVLSGFLITGILLKSKNQRHYFKSFYARRALRIFPPYYALLTLALVVLPMLGHPMLLGWASAHQAWLWFYGTNLPPHAQWFDLGHLWTLAVEEHFYFVWPFVVYWTQLTRLRQICILTIPIALLVRLLGVHTPLEGYTMRFTLGRFDSLAIGAFAATLPREPLLFQKHVERVTLAFALTSSGFLAISEFAPSTRPMVLSFGSPIFAGAFAGLVFLASIRRLPLRTMSVLESSILGRVGKYSYGMYLFHLPLLRLSRPVSVALGISLSTLSGKLVWMASMGLIAYVAALLSWYIWEQQFLRFKTLFTAS